MKKRITLIMMLMMIVLVSCEKEDDKPAPDDGTVLVPTLDMTQSLTGTTWECLTNNVYIKRTYRATIEFLTDSTYQFSSGFRPTDSDESFNMRKVTAEQYEYEYPYITFYRIEPKSEPKSEQKIEIIGNAITGLQLYNPMMYNKYILLQ